MKKTILLYMAIFLVLFAGSFLLLTILVSCTSPGQTRDTVTLEFRGNPTTGYEWTCTVPENASVELDDEKYTPDTHANSGMIAGSGGVYGFTFRAVREGETEILFSYGRSWEESPARTTSYILTVDGDMNITAREKEHI